MNIEARFYIERGSFTLHADLTVPMRKVTALLGPSGCGKTSLLRAIAGLDRYPGGFLKIGDTTWQDDRIFLPVHRRKLGYVFQETSLFDFLSVRRNISYGRRRAPEGDHLLPLSRIIDLLGIGSLLERRPHTLSGGERQRVAIARALASDPQLLLMDEPLASLDVARKNEILPYLESVHREWRLPVIYVSHSPDEVARLADQVALFENGWVTEAGSVFEMFSRLDLPLAHLDDAETIIEARVVGHDEDYELTVLDFPGGRFSVSRKPVAVGQQVRLRVAARDVSLTLEQQTGTSILNIFPSTVEAVSVEGKSQVTVRLMIGDTPLLSRITRKSADTLGIRPGKQVYAQVKSVALLV